jgi:hypothetical protein
MSLELIPHIIADTPLWVFAIFAYVILQGYRRLSPQVMTIRRVIVIPLLFVLWGLYGLSFRPLGLEAVAAAWLPTAMLGTVLGTVTSPRALRVDRVRGLVWQPGSVLPLVRLILIFGGHYALNIAMAMRPDLRPTLSLCDIAVSGMSAGYFLGWLAAFQRKTSQAPEADLSAFAVAS